MGYGGIWEGSWPEVLPQVADLVALAEHCSLCNALGTPDKERGNFSPLVSQSLWLVWCLGGAVPAGLCIILMLPSLQSDAKECLQ